MKKILNVILFGVISINSALAAPLGQDLDIEVQLLMTAQFTLQSWNDPNVNLWTVSLQNKTGETKHVYVEFRLSVQNVSGISESDNPVAWGITDPYDVQPYSTAHLRNASFTEDKMMAFEITQAFQDMIETNGYLPAGKYDIKMLAWENVTYQDVDRSNRQVIQTENNRILDLSWDHSFVDERYQEDWSWDKPEGRRQGESLENILVSKIVLNEPVQRADVTDFQPWFRWDSPGFRQGVDIDYRLKVAQYDPELHSSYDDAFEDVTSLYLDTEWDESYASINHVRENGTVRTISLQYPSSERELACGYEYVWQVEAREYIDGYDYIGQKGIWGWPDPIESPVYVFSYGNRLTRDRMSSPVYGGVINSVNPVFNWDLIACAREYEIWLSDAAVDPMVENPSWQSDPIQSLPFSYPMEEEPLVPGKRYAWKVRMNPGPDPSPWSDISTFTVSAIQPAEPVTGDEILTVLPTFNADVPTGIPYYELRISDINDQSVDMGNVLNTIIQNLPYKLRVDENGWLYPGRQYFWKLIPLNAGETMLGLPDDHTNISYFRVSSVTLQAPVNGENQAERTPIFSWEAPSGQDLFELHISSDDDPNIENPFFTSVLRQKMFQYPGDADIPLIPGKSYFWRVVPLDPDEIPGDPSPPFTFSVKSLDFPDVDWSMANRELTAFWTPLASAQGYRILISDEPDLQEDGRFVQAVWSSDLLYETSLRLSVSELRVEPDMTLYYQLGVTTDGENFMWDSPGSLGINLFNEEDLFIRLETDPRDPLQPLIALVQGVPDVDEYLIFISSDPEGEEIISEYSTLMFPVALDGLWDQIRNYDRVYVTVHALSGDMIVAKTSEPVAVNPNAMMAVLYEPFLVEPDPAGNPGFMVRYTQPLQFAQSVVVSAAMDPSMDSPVFSEAFSVNSLPLMITDDVFGYGDQVFVHLQLLRDDTPLGAGSQVYEVILPSHPGANEQVGIVAEWLKDQDLIRIERTNNITGATNYQLIAYADAEGMDEIWRMDDMPGMTVTLERSELGLGFDENVYVQIIPVWDDQVHGIPSELRRIYIESVIPPVLSESILMWEHSDPPAPQYEVRLSVDPEFRSDVLTGVVTQNLITEEQFELYWDTFYYWQVRGLGMNDESWGPWSRVRTYLSSSGPEIALESPDNAMVFETIPEFVWTCPENLTFILEISETETFESSIYVYETPDKNHLFSGDIRQFEENKNYFWRVRGIHTVKGSVISLIRSFTLQNIESLAEESPEDTGIRFVSPKNRAILLSNQLRIAWTGGPEDMGAYELHFSYDEDFTDPRSQVMDIKEFKPSGPGYFEEKQDVYARVRPLDNDNNPVADWSNPVVFQVVSNMRPDLESPPNGEKLFSSDIILSWNAVRHADRYEVMLAGDEEFTSVLWNNDRMSEINVSLPRSVSEELEYDKEYFWRVRSIISGGYTFSWSVPFVFVLSNEKITNLEYPLDEVFEPGSLSFSWQKPAGISHAILQISLNSDFSTILFESPPLSENQYTYPSDAPVPLKSSTDYFCRVISSDGEGTKLADPSQTGTFRIKGQVIEIELIFSAAEGGE